MWVDRLFIFNSNKPEGQTNFMYQLVKTFRPGSMDTSLVSTDNINNPRTMNAVYAFMPRMGLAQQLWHEQLAGGEVNNKQFNDFTSSGPLTAFYSPETAYREHAACAQGWRRFRGATRCAESRVPEYRPVQRGMVAAFQSCGRREAHLAHRDCGGGEELGVLAGDRSGHVQTALFFLKAAKPDPLAKAPGGPGYLNASAATLARGKVVFADTCARCHSSKAPTPPESVRLEPQNCAGAGYLDCFKRYWAWSQTDEFKTQMRTVVQAPDFLDSNYLSTDARIPVTLLRTNVCSPLATNGIAGNIWDNFTSHSYKQLPSVGTVTLSDPFTGEPVSYQMPAGGRGYTRVPSLISIWSTAPFLLNNSVGPFDPDPSVAHRLQSFEASIEQMLWPEKRDRDPVLGAKVPGLIDRTTQRSDVRIPVGFVPEALQPLQGHLHRWFPSLVSGGGDIVLGPIPKGTPIGLLANIRLLAESNDPKVQAAHAANLGDLLLKLNADLLTAPAAATDEQLLEKFANLKKPMLALSKCPDLVVNRGHYFGTAQFNEQDGLSDDEKAFGHEPELTDEDKHALIAFLMTF